MKSPFKTELVSYTLPRIELTASAAVQLKDDWPSKLYALQSVPVLDGGAEAVVSDRRRVVEGRGAVAFSFLWNDVIVREHKEYSKNVYPKIYYVGVPNMYLYQMSPNLIILICKPV